MISRSLSVDALLRDRYSVFLFGPRGVGKTSFIDQLPNVAIKFDLLKGETSKALTLDPAQFRAQVAEIVDDQPTNKPPKLIVLDEVQLVPQILNDVHWLIEKYPKQVCFILTGSSARKLKREGANMLGGRAATKHMFPLTSAELKIDIYKALQFGTLPRVYLDKGDPKPFLSSYVDTYLREEVKQESLIRKIDAFIRFLDLAAQLNSENINFSKLGRQCGVASSTIQQYYSILEDTLLVNRVDGWSHSVKRQLIIGPRYYFFDCGVLNATRRELHLELSSGSYRFGKLFESFIVNEFRAYCSYNALDYKFNYWRTNSGLEVDLILSRSSYDPPIAIEIKSGTSPDATELRGLKAFKEDNPAAKLYCICMAESPYERGGIKFVPWEQFKRVLG